MNRLLIKAKLGVGGALCAAASIACMPAAAAPVTSTGQAKAVAIRPLSLVKAGDLSFGNILAGPAAGTVTVNPSTDAPTYVGVAGAGGTIQAARFIGAGSANQLVFVRWNTAPFTIARQGGGATMIVDTLRTNSVLFVFAGNDPRIIPADRVLDIRFGARLRVGANQPEGTYGGSFAVTIDYP